LLASSAWAVVAAPATAGAAPEAVANVLELGADFDQVSLAQALTSLLRLRVTDGGDFLLASDNSAFLVVAPAVRCDTRGFRSRPLRFEADANIDARCLRSVGTHLGAKRFFWGYVYHGAEGQLGVKLHLFREGRGDVAKALPLVGGDGARERLVERLYLHLVRPEAISDVRVEAPAGLEGELWVDGRPRGAYATPATELTLVAGEHRIEVRGGGKVLASSRPMVVAGKPARVALARVPAEVPLGPPPPDVPPVMPPPRTNAWQRPAGVAAVGLGAVALGAGVFASLRTAALDDRLGSGSYERYRAAFPGQNPCDVAARGTNSPTNGAAGAKQVDDTCSQGATFRAAQWVAYPLGAALVGVGTYLLLTAPKGSAAPPSRRTGAGWSLAPAWGPAGTGATVYGQF
jgi:hypothetical protein